MNGHSLRYFLWSTLILGALVIAGCKEETSASIDVNIINSAESDQNLNTGAVENEEPGNGMISGVIRGLNPEASTVTLKKLEKLNEKNLLVNVANTQMDSEGSFEFEAKAASEYGYYQLFAGGHAVVLVTGPSEDLFIEVDAVEGEKYFLRPKIQGSQQTKAVAAYYDVIFPLEQRLRNEELKSRSSDPQIRTMAMAQLQSKRDSVKSVSIQFCQSYRGQLSSLVALEALNPSEYKELYKVTLDALQANHSSSPYFKKLKGIFEQTNRARTIETSPPQQRQTPNSKYIQGDEAPDIVMNDPNGVERRLSDLRGKVVLLDFWASWCGPCRRENPRVVQAYNKYRDQGFEVFSVSLDRSMEPWKKAIETDNLIWPNHVSDMNYWQNAAAREYGISSIPHTMLIDRDGLILATHLRGPGLESALKGIFGN